MAAARDSASHAETDKPSELNNQVPMPFQQPSERFQGPASASSSGDGGSFDCNICLELAQDPVVTLCGHLFCWPCLYRWLRLHSTCQECPVCKAVVEEEKLVPLYGRGKFGSPDPRKKPVPGVNVPQRPAGQRPETARPPENQFQQQGFNFMGGPGGHLSTARLGNFSFSAGFGLFPSLFGLQMPGYPDGTGFGPGHPFGLPMGWHTAHLHAHPHAAHSLMPNRHQEAVLSKLLMVLGILVVLCILIF